MGSILKGVASTVASVISSCCRAPLVTHLARDNNFADCNAKESNQSKMLKLVIIGIGYKFILFVNGNPTYVIISFITLACCKIFFMYKAMQTLELRDPNEQRIAIFYDY